jgi:hypothetical protein
MAFPFPGAYPDSRTIFLFPLLSYPPNPFPEYGLDPIDRLEIQLP